MLLDCDLRRPSLHKVMGVKTPGSMGDMLRGRVPAEQHLLRMGPNSFHAGPNLAFGFNHIPESYPAELLQDPGTATALVSPAAAAASVRWKIEPSNSFSTTGRASAQALPGRPSP